MNESTNGKTATVEKIKPEEFARLSMDDKKQAIQERRFRLPKPGTPEWNEYEKAVNSPTPSGESKESAPVPPQAVPEEKPTPVAEKNEVPSSAPEPVAKPITPQADEAKKSRFQSVDEAVKALEALETEKKQREDLFNKQQEVINKLNGSAHNTTRQNAALKSELDKLNARIKEMEEKSKTSEVQVEDIPDAPDPDDQKYADDGGVNSESYLKDLAAFNKKIVPHLRKMKAVPQNFEQVAKKADEALSMATFQHEMEAKREAELANKEVDDAADELQSELGLTTSRSWKEINTQVKIANGIIPAAPEVAELAKQYIQALPKGDVDNFNRLSKAVNLAYDFTTPKPRPKYDRKSNAFKGLLIDEGFVINVAKKPEIDLVALHEKQKQEQARNNATAGIPPQMIGADENVASYNTDEEKAGRLRELTAMRQSRGLSFDKDTKLFEEYARLREHFGTPVRKK